MLGKTIEQKVDRRRLNKDKTKQKQLDRMLEETV